MSWITDAVVTVVTVVRGVVSSLRHNWGTGVLSLALAVALSQVSHAMN